MDALLTIVGTAAVFVVFAALSAVFGVDTREGFTDRSLRRTYR